jgi:predicted DNA-binding transcriptional regulator AlpA
MSQHIESQLEFILSELQAIRKQLKKPAPAAKWVNKKQACQITGLSLRTLDNKIRERQFVFRKAGTRVYLEAEQLHEWVQKTIVKRA